MKKLKYCALAAMLVLNLFSAACAEDNKATAKITSEKIRTLVESELAVGASAQDIEQFFKRHAYLFEKDLDPPYCFYDRIQNKYNSIIRHNRFEGIGIDIYLDDQKRLKKIDVRNYFTAP